MILLPTIYFYLQLIFFILPNHVTFFLFPQTKRIKYCRRADPNFSVAVLESEACSCGTGNSLDLADDYISPKIMYKKELTDETGPHNESNMGGDYSASPNPTVAFYNIEYEGNRYRGDHYGVSTCFEAARELMPFRGN